MNLMDFFMTVTMGAYAALMIVAVLYLGVLALVHVRDILRK
jgi:hypothetical protein